MNEPTSADYKALALVYAYEALIKTLSDDSALNMDHLFGHLAGAQKAATRVGENEAAHFLGELAKNLQRIG